jgi:hypothetical protein
MKINIMYHTDSPRSGFLNIDPYSDGTVKNTVVGDPKNLDEHVDDASCKEIVALRVLDNYSSQEVDSIINHWVSKLRMGGSICIGGTDMRNVAKSLYQGNIGINDANMLIFGNQDKDWEHKQSCLDVNIMVDILKERGLKIVKKRVNGYDFVVVAERSK